jgi:hypothetical protein
MKAKLVFEDIRFNFDKPAPYKRFISQRGISGPSVRNPRKSGYGRGLTAEEERIRDKHQERIEDLKDEISNLEDEIQGLESDIEDLAPHHFEEGEVEQFDSDIIEQYGFQALDILNSGISDEEKIKRIDQLNPTKDFGRRDFEDLMHNYNYFHPEEPDEKELEKVLKRIKAVRNVIKEREGMIDRLETKIYNLENY